MKTSKYNFFIEYDEEEMIAYNLFTNSLALMNKKRIT